MAAPASAPEEMAVATEKRTGEAPTKPEAPRLEKGPIAPKVVVALAEVTARRDAVAKETAGLALAEFTGEPGAQERREALERQLAELDAEIERLTLARQQALKADELAAAEKRMAAIEAGMGPFEAALQARLDAAARLDAGAKLYADAWAELLDASERLSHAMPASTALPAGFRTDRIPAVEARGAIYRHSRISGISGRLRVPPGSAAPSEMVAFAPGKIPAMADVIAGENEAIKQTARRQVAQMRRHLLGEEETAS
jgi:hypothetical protein